MSEEILPHAHTNEVGVYNVTNGSMSNASTLAEQHQAIESLHPH